MLYINSPGGSVAAGLAIYDTMQYVKPDVTDDLHGTGRVDGLGPDGGGGARKASRAAERPFPAPPAMDVGNAGAGVRPRDPRQATSHPVEATGSAGSPSSTRGQVLEKVERDTDRDFILEAEEARKYWPSIDHVFTSRDDTQR